MLAFARNDRAASVLWVTFSLLVCSDCHPSYSPWDTASDSGPWESCPVGYPPSCPVTAMCMVYKYRPSRDFNDHATPTCAAVPPGCAIGKICDCSPWFTPLCPPGDGGACEVVRADPNVCYRCREQVLGSTRTSVTCIRSG